MKQKELANKAIETLLQHYNEGADEPLIAVESWEAGLIYTLYRKVEPWDEYREVIRAGESDTVLWLSHKLNERTK